MQLNILVIAEYFAPVNSIASIRWTKLVKYLQLNHGVSIDLLTTEKNYDGYMVFSNNASIDPSIKDDIQYVDKVMTLKGGFRLKCVYAVHNILRIVKRKKPVTKNEKNSKDNESKIGNTTLKARAINNLRSRIEKSEGDLIVKGFDGLEIDLRKYDVIISSYGPVWPHHLAAKIKQARPEIIWIADYRDPLVFSAESNTEAARSFPVEVTGTADCILGVSEGGVRSLFLSDDFRVEVLSNGFDPDEVRSRERMQTEKFEIVYTGMLYDLGEAAQDLRPICRALTSLMEQGEIDPDDCIMRYAGPSENIFFSQISDFSGIPHESLGVISREKALEMQSGASVLAFATWNTKTAAGVITGKLFEYIGSSVPIAGVCTGGVPNSMARQMIELSGAGFCYEEAKRDIDFPELVDFLKRLYVEWKSYGITQCRTDIERLGAYSHSRLADKLYRLILELIQEQEKRDDRQEKKA